MSEILSPAHYAIFPRTPMLLHSITQNRDLFGLNLVYYYGDVCYYPANGNARPSTPAPHLQRHINHGLK